MRGAGPGIRMLRRAEINPALVSSPPVGLGHVGLNRHHQRCQWGQEHGRHGEFAGRRGDVNTLKHMEKDLSAWRCRSPVLRCSELGSRCGMAQCVPPALEPKRVCAMRLAYHVFDVFTHQRFAGNPLAVVLDADALLPARMQIIAREFNLSETVFVLKPDNPAHSARVRIFTPVTELPFAGHPTVGAAALLALLKSPVPSSNADALIVLEEEVGPVRVGVRLRAGAAPFAEFDAPRLPQESGALPAADRLAAALGLIPAEIGFENHRRQHIRVRASRISGSDGQSASGVLALGGSVSGWRRCVPVLPPDSPHHVSIPCADVRSRARSAGGPRDRFGRRRPRWRGSPL